MAIGDSIFRGFQQGEQIASQPMRQRAQEIALEQEELGLDKQNAEFQRFLDKSNLESMVQGALEFSSIPQNDINSQNAFLQKRIQEIKSRGGDAQDTIHLLNMNPQQRQETIQNVFRIGERAGILRPQEFQKPSSVQVFKQNLIDAGIDPTSPQGVKAIQDFAIGKKQPLVQNILPDGKPVPKVVSEFEKKLGSEDAERWSSIILEGDTAETQIASIDQLIGIRPETGIFEDVKTDFARVLDGLGFDSLSKKVANVPKNESFKAVSNRIVLEAMASQKGSQTEKDFQVIKATVPTLTDSQEAAEWKAAALKAIALRKVEKRDFFEKERANARDQGIPFDFRDATKRWNKYVNTTPLVSDVAGTDESGLPTFFYEYEQLVKERLPEISRDKVIEKWRERVGQ